MEIRGSTETLLQELNGFTSMHGLTLFDSVYDQFARHSLKHIALKISVQPL